MKKILLGCFLLTASITIFADSNVLSTLDQLELNFQQLEAEEKAMYEKRKSEAEEAQRTLAQQRETYQQIVIQEKRIADVKNNRYYKDQYNQLAKKYADTKKALEEDMRRQEEIINLFEMIK
ncbi:adhesion protein FadA [Fusobacterium varium]|jgi:galactokinase|uniref:Adhesin n=1 Tax=Fusobacterium varium ATCC 27725 TaxID=469618 RepID=A0ABM6U1P0_FUSVA|nr:adhesion protein FadA [Fusobacterium varium]AVQ30202.1 adhesin [Fusobacterium varium ATCC 27725]EES64767.1 adhesion protein FadA [Fusobacterium varium ATCC 27725]UYI78608.1 MAG: adhesion protein FadA [Fusobacterium varium]VEH37859.1 Adhesion protein FadA [Fusobacterium varium]